MNKQRDFFCPMSCCLMRQQNKLEIWISGCQKPGRQWWLPDTKGSSSQSEVVEMHLLSAEFQWQQSAGNTQKCCAAFNPSFSFVFLWNHRIRVCVGTFAGHPVQPSPLTRANWTWFLRDFTSPILKNLKDGDSVGKNPSFRWVHSWG